MSTQLTEAEQAFVDSLPASGVPEGTPPSEETNTPSEDSSPPEAQAEGTPAEGTTPEEEDSFTSVDVRSMLEGLPPEAREVAEAAYKNFQGDYTRKAQQLAERAKQLEDLGDPEQVRTAVEFYNGIQTDPEFAQEVHGYLSRVFEEAGMTPAQAAQAATEEVAASTEAAQAPSFDEDPDAALKAEIEDLKAWRSTFEAQQAEAARQREEDEMAAVFLQQEMAIRHSLKDTGRDPDQLEKDLDLAYDIATSTGGNLHEAWAKLTARDEGLLSHYVEKKASVEDTPSDVVTPVSAVAPPDIPRLPDGSPDLEAVHKIAVQKLLNAQAGRE